MNQLTPSAIVSIVSDVLIALAATSTAIIALCGLKSWRTEIKGRTQFELARQILKDIFSFKEEINRARYPILVVLEPISGDRTEDENRKEMINSYMKEFNRRIEPVGEMSTQLSVDAIEASVFWGPDIKERIEQLRMHASILKVAFQKHLLAMKENWENDPKLEKMYFKNFEIVFSTSGEDDLDAFDSRINEINQWIENELAPILGRKKPKKQRIN